MSATPHPIRVLLAQREFLGLWFVGGMSMTMRWLEMLATSIYVYDLSGSALQVALMNFVRMAPMLLAGSWIGAMAERHDRRRIMILGLASSAVSAAVLGVLAMTDRIELWHIALGAFIGGLHWAGDMPVRRTILGEIAGTEFVGTAMSLDAATGNLTRVIGPLLGGALYQLVGLHGAFFAGALIHGASLLAVLPLISRPGPHAGEGDAARPGVIASMIEGIRLSIADRALLGAMGVTLLMNMLAFPYQSMIPVIGRNDLALDPVPIGLLVAAEGVGAFIGSVLIARYIRPTGYMRLYVFSAAIVFVAALLFALSRQFETSIMLLAVSGFGVAGFSSMQSALVLSLAPAHLRVRAMGSLAMCIGAQPLGIIYIGMLAEALGTPGAIIAMEIQGLIAMAILVWALPPLRR
ncbi:MAG: MFS transporter [Alphaproteobacteria bacterium]|nr:MFS transporter [Alphaproteobacteria bacterium]